MQENLSAKENTATLGKQSARYQAGFYGSFRHFNTFRAGREETASGHESLGVSQRKHSTVK